MDSPTKERSGADLEAASNGEGEEDDEDSRRDSLTGAKVHPSAKAGAGPKSGAHQYKEVPTMDHPMGQVQDANEVIKSKFHHGKGTRASRMRGLAFL